MSWIYWLVAFGVAYLLFFRGRNRDVRLTAMVMIGEHGAPTVQLSPPTAEHTDLALAVLCHASDILWILLRENPVVFEAFKEFVGEALDFWDSDNANSSLLDRMPSARAVRNLSDNPRAVHGGEKFKIVFSRTNYRNLQNKVSAITTLPRPGLAANIPWSFVVFLNCVVCIVDRETGAHLYRALKLWYDAAFGGATWGTSPIELRRLFQMSLGCWTQSEQGRGGAVGSLI